MRSSPSGFGLLVIVAAAAVFAAAAAAVAKVGHSGLAWIGILAGALTAVLAAFSRNLVELIYERSSAALKGLLDRDKILKGIPGYRRRVAESNDRIMLSIHPAIPLPADAPADLSDEFPLYVPPRYRRRCAHLDSQPG